MSINTCKKMFAAVLAAAAMFTSTGVTFAEETAVNYVEQSVLDSDYNKINVTSYFANCANTDYTQGSAGSTTNPTYAGITTENIIKYDWQPLETVASREGFDLRLDTGKVLRMYPKDNMIEYWGTSNAHETFTYDFAYADNTTYSVYAEHRDGGLIFGIKKASDEKYNIINIKNTDNSGLTCMRMRTFGFKTKVSNAYVYTKKVPMPEIVQSVLDSDYDVFDAKNAISNGGHTYSISSNCTSSYDGLSDNSVLKITMKPGNSSAAYMYVRLYLGASETIEFNQTTDKITYKNSKTDKTETIDYDFANDGTSDTVGTTEYNVYVSKIDNTLVFGIKKAAETMYTWFSIDNAQSDSYTTLKFGTFGYLTGVSHAYVYTKKIPMPEVAQAVLDSDYDVYDAKDNLFNNGNTYSLSSTETTSYEGLSDNSVIKMTMKPGKSEAVHNYVRLYLGANETITFNQTTDKITYKNSKTDKTETIDYDFANDGTSDTVGTTEYNVYVSKIDNTLVFGIKKAAETMYTWFSIDNAQSDSYTTLKFGTFGYLTGVSHAYVYTKKNEIPLPAAEELAANYTLKKDDSSVFAAAAKVADENEPRNSATVGDVALKNYVTYLKAAFTDSGSYGGDGFVFDFGRDKVTFNIYSGGIKYNTESENAIGYTFAANKVYDIAAAKTGSRFVFGIKPADEERYTWFERTSAENDNTDYLKATENYIGANVSEFKLYTLNDYKYGNVETVTADNQLTSTFKITRTNQDSIGTGIFITAVYRKGEYPVMDSVAATEVKTLTLDSEVTFENTVNVPTGEYEVKYFLWKNFNELIPVVSGIR